MFSLKVQPLLWRRVEVARQAQRHLCSDTTALLEKISEFGGCRAYTGSNRCLGLSTLFDQFRRADRLRTDVGGRRELGIAEFSSRISSSNLLGFIVRRVRFRSISDRYEHHGRMRAIFDNIEAAIFIFIFTNHNYLLEYGEASIANLLQCIKTWPSLWSDHEFSSRNPSRYALYFVSGQCFRL